MSAAFLAMLAALRAISISLLAMLAVLFTTSVYYYGRVFLDNRKFFWKIEAKGKEFVNILETTITFIKVLKGQNIS